MIAAFFDFAYYPYDFISHISFVLHMGFTFLASFLVYLLCGAIFINYAQTFLSTVVRNWTPQSHQSKNNTPTMGGLLIMTALFVGIIVSAARCFSIYTCLAIIICLGFSCIGGIDDWYKIVYRAGISARVKFFSQIVISAISMVLLLMSTSFDTRIMIPFFASQGVEIGLFLYGVWGTFLLVATSNAVNLTDGLDGLATGCLIPNYLFFTGICMLHLGILSNVSAAFIGAAVIGALIGFSWFNVHPARIFMGDVGSLPLGALLAYLALISKCEILLAFTGGVFVIETLSVILQVASYKIRKKRLFRMAPFHHHLELGGWPETWVVARFTIVSYILCIVATMVYLSSYL